MGRVQATYFSIKYQG